MKIFRAAMIAVFVAVSAPAQAFQIFTDQAAWEEAMAGMTINKDYGAVTRTDEIHTITTGFSGPITVLNISTTSAPYSFGSTLSLHFHFDQCVISCSAPLMTAFTFENQIAGFGGITRLNLWPLTVNGQVMPHVSLDLGFEHFVGFIGDISELMFVSTYGYTDNGIALNMRDLQIAVVPEPASLALLLIPLALLARRRTSKA